MEMEKINDNTIRVILTNDDLDKRGITVLALMGNHAEIEKFFYSILDEVDTDDQFADTDAVTFQMIPGKTGGIELLISKADPTDTATAKQPADADVDSQDVNEVLNILDAHANGAYADENNDGVDGLAQLMSSEMKDEKKAAVTPQQARKIVYSFASLDDLVHAVALLDEEQRADLRASLYLLDKRYYLWVDLRQNPFAATHTKPLEYVVAVLAEYGRKEKLTSWAVAERGQLIAQDRALAVVQRFM